MQVEQHIFADVALLVRSNLNEILNGVEALNHSTYTENDDADELLNLEANLKNGEEASDEIDLNEEITADLQSLAVNMYVAGVCYLLNYFEIEKPESLDDLDSGYTVADINDPIMLEKLAGWVINFSAALVEAEEHIENIILESQGSEFTDDSLELISSYEEAIDEELPSYELMALFVGQDTEYAIFQEQEVA